MPHFCLDELRLLVAAIIFATPWLGWLRAWWHHRRRHVGCKQERAPTTEPQQLAQLYVHKQRAT